MFYIPVNRIIQTVALVDKFEMNKDFVSHDCSSPLQYILSGAQF